MECLHAFWMDFMKPKNTKNRYGEHIHLRLLHPNDIDQYYLIGFEHFDAETQYFTASDMCSKQVIVDYVHRIYPDPTRYDFLILNAQDDMLGEVVLNEINMELRSCGFRIAIFDHHNYNQGFGSEAIHLLLDFAFHELLLERIELEVFDYNQRALHVYQKMGFQITNTLSKALHMNGEDHDIYEMELINPHKKITI